MSIHPYPLSLIFLFLLCSCTLNTSESNQNSSTAAIRATPTPTPTPELLTVPPTEPNPPINPQVAAYIKSLQPAPAKSQGVWMQTKDKLLANHQGTTPLPAASITKVATTLVALKTFGPDHRFLTQIGTTGTIREGVIEGDLIIQGGEDPFFVWEEAIKLGNTLNQMGIKRVQGDLIITGKFYMNYNTAPVTAGNLLKQALNSQTWTPVITRQYQTLPLQTPKPQVLIEGQVKTRTTAPANMRILVRHSSYPLAELLKKMNNFSNNPMAEMIANSVGGAKTVAQRAAEIAQVPSQEIYLINGSGLTYENKISPRAAIAMFRAVELYLRSHNLTVADVFTIASVDEGVLSPRQIPPLAVVKSGSLGTVSALVGGLPTQNQGIIWFALMNGQGDLNNFRKQQDTFLNQIIRQSGQVSNPPQELAPTGERLGKSSQIEIVQN